MAVRIDDNHNQPNKKPVRPHQDELAEHAPWFLMTVDAILSQGLWGSQGPTWLSCPLTGQEKEQNSYLQLFWVILRGKKLHYTFNSRLKVRCQHHEGHPWNRKEACLSCALWGSSLINGCESQRFTPVTANTPFLLVFTPFLLDIHSCIY